MNAIEIRAATPADAGVVADYHARCFTNTAMSPSWAVVMVTSSRRGRMSALMW